MLQLIPIDAPAIDATTLKYWLLTNLSEDRLIEVDAVRKSVEVVTRDVIRDVPVLVRDFDPERKGSDASVQCTWFTSSAREDILCFFDEYYLERGDTRVIHAPGGPEAYGETTCVTLYPYGENPWERFYDMDCMDIALCDYSYEGVRRRDWFVKRATWADETLQRLEDELYLTDELDDPTLHSIIEVVKAKEVLNEMKGRVE